MIANTAIALSPPLAAYIWAQVFLLAGGTNFHTSFWYSLAFIAVILIPIGIYHGRLTIFAGGLAWLFVWWNVMYQPFAVLF